MHKASSHFFFCIFIANGKIPEGEDEEAAMKWLF